MIDDDCDDHLGDDDDDDGDNLCDGDDFIALCASTCTQFQANSQKITQQSNKKLPTIIMI